MNVVSLRTATVLAAGVGLVCTPFAANAAHASHGQPATRVVVHRAASSSSGWKWTKAFSLGKATGIKKKVEYGTYGISCPSTKLCVIPMDGTSVNPPYNSPAGDFYTTSPAKGKSGWKLSKWSEDYAPGDSLSGHNIDCTPAGAATDCIIAGRAPVAGSYNQSYGASVFQTGTPTAANWGAATVDEQSAGFGAVSCWVNVQCAEIDDNGSIYTTAGAQVTSAASVFPKDAGFSGIWSMACAPYRKGVNSFCVAAPQSASGAIAWTTDPGDSTGKWTNGNRKGATIYDIGCYEAGGCLLNDEGKLLRSSGKTDGKGWLKTIKTLKLPKVGDKGVSTLQCTGQVCAVVGTSAKLGQWLSVSKDPAHGGWHTIALSSNPKKPVLKNGFAFVACPTTKLCVVGDGYGNVAVGKA